MTADLAAKAATKPRHSAKEVWSVVGVVVAIVAFLVLMFSPSTAVSVMQSTASTLGFGAGATVGSVPVFMEAVYEGIEAAR